MSGLQIATVFLALERQTWRDENIRQTGIAAILVICFLNKL